MTAGSVARIVCDRRPGVGTVFNPLDPAIIVEGDEHTAVGQDELLLMVAEVACRQAHDQGERTRLRPPAGPQGRAKSSRSRKPGSDPLGRDHGPLRPIGRMRSLARVTPDGTPTLTRQGLVTVETVTQSGADGRVEPGEVRRR